MSRLKRTQKYMSIRKQILLSIILICFVILVSLGTFLFSISKKNIENNYQQSNEYNLQLFSRILEDKCEGIVCDLRDLLENDSFMGAISSEDSVGSYFSTKNKITLEKTMNSILDSEAYLEGMLVVNSDGAFRYLCKSTKNTNVVSNYYYEDNLLESSWIEVAKEAFGKEVFFGYNILFEDEDLISVVKAINDNLNDDPVGYVVLLIDKSMLAETLQLDEEDGYNSIYLVVDMAENKAEDNESYSVVYYEGDEANKEEIIDDYMNSSEDSKYLYSSYHDGTSGWELINVIEKSTLSVESEYIKWVTVIAIFALILLAIVVANLISRRITKPLKQLEDVIAQVGKGDYQVGEDFDDSEIGRVGNKFKDMANNNLKLHEELLNSTIQEREAELLLLQSQINPHFLYNTLNTLYCKALVDNADEVAEMVKNLSDTFKLSLNKGDKFITINDEIEKIIAYMKIQNMRYNKKIELRLEIDEDIRNEKILSFILQPIVENAVYHGLEPKGGTGAISITGYRNPDDDKVLKIIVNDNGVGIRDQRTLKKGYGVRNVCERIKIAYGEQYIPLFESKKDEGTTVFFTIPVYKEGEDYV